MDNNVVASPRFKEIIAEIRDLGFVPGAKLRRPQDRVAMQRRVDFNQGVDARILCKDSMYLRELSTISLRPLRIAFDHLGLKEPYEQAVRYSHQHGLTELSNYMLYNFKDSPQDLFERMRLNVHLNEELKIRIWSFPMRYQPTDLPDRSHVGPKWTRYQLRSMQIVLQATHGVVSGAPEYFKRAFGDTADEFQQILLLPHDYTFNREWYERFDEKKELYEYQDIAKTLTESDRAELLSLLSSVDPREMVHLPARTSNRKVKEILPFYVPKPKSELFEIWRKQRELLLAEKEGIDSLAEDERVEDAGLEFEESDAAVVRRTAPVQKKRAVA
jgi:hypothetical protein